jgi:hypothetical protein
VITLKIKEPDNVIKRRIFDALANELKLKMSKLLATLEAYVRIFIKQSIYESPTYLELVNHGVLWWEVGLPEVKGQLDDIIQTLISQVECKEKQRPTVLPTGLTCIITVSAVDPTFSQIMDIGKYISHTKKGDAQVPWLKWLLTAGDIVQDLRDWELRIGGYPQSRTGGALMFNIKGTVQIIKIEEAILLINMVR